MSKETTYRERIDEYLGPLNEGETRYYDIPDGDIVDNIKKHLKGNFSVTLWAHECPEEQIRDNDEALTKAGIVHYYDDVITGFLCFNTKEDMDDFRRKVLEALKNEDYE